MSGAARRKTGRTSGGVLSVSDMASEEKTSCKCLLLNKKKCCF